MVSSLKTSHSDGFVRELTRCRRQQRSNSQLAVR